MCISDLGKIFVELFCCFVLENRSIAKQPHHYTKYYIRVIYTELVQKSKHLITSPDDMIRIHPTDRTFHSMFWLAASVHVLFYAYQPVETARLE